MNHLGKSLGKISTCYLYSPLSMHAHAHVRARTHTHTHVIYDFVSTWADMAGNLQQHWKSYKQYLRNSTLYWAVLLWHICQAAKCYVSPIIDLQQHLSEYSRKRRKPMPTFESSVSEELIVVGDSQTENTEISMFNTYTYSFQNRGVCVYV